MGNLAGRARRLTRRVVLVLTLAELREEELRLTGASISALHALHTLPLPLPRELTHLPRLTRDNYKRESEKRHDNLAVESR